MCKNITHKHFNTNKIDIHIKILDHKENTKCIYFGIQCMLQFQHVAELLWVDVIIRKVDEQSVNIQSRKCSKMNPYFISTQIRIVSS